MIVGYIIYQLIITYWWYFFLRLSSKDYDVSILISQSGFISSIFIFYIDASSLSCTVMNKRSCLLVIFNTFKFGRLAPSKNVNLGFFEISSSLINVLDNLNQLSSILWVRSIVFNLFENALNLTNLWLLMRSIYSNELVAMYKFFSSTLFLTEIDESLFWIKLRSVNW